MTDIVIPARRVLTAGEATALVGERIPDNLTPTFDSPQIGDTVRVQDADSGELLALVTRLDAPVTRRLREVVTTVELGRGSGRMSSKLDNLSAGGTFGWAPKRPLVRRESCTATWIAAHEPDNNLFLARLGGALGNEFRELAPEIAAHDLDILDAVDPSWLMEESALWTSGVINRTSQLPYHRDSTNFPTWSAMPTVRYRMRGGHLHLPEYDLVFPCGDGDVSWFCGQEFVHGVTPMWAKDDTGYRYSAVYYALRGMKDCSTVAIETAEAANRRTARERKMADQAREKLAGR